MNDPIFQPFAPGNTLNSEAPKAEPKKKSERPKRGARRTATKKETPVKPKVEVKKKPAAEPARKKSTRRKPRSIRPPKAAPAVRLDINTALAAFSGLKETDTRMLVMIADILNTAGKSARGRLIVALGKLFPA